MLGTLFLQDIFFFFGGSLRREGAKDRAKVMRKSCSFLFICSGPGVVLLS